MDRQSDPACNWGWNMTDAFIHLLIGLAGIAAGAIVLFAEGK